MTQSEITTLLKSPLFHTLTETELQQIIGCLQANKKTHKAQEYIILQGNQVDYIGIIISGSVELIKENLSGNRHIVDFLGPSQIFAEGIVCTSKRISPVLVRTVKPSTILYIPYERIIHSCGSACLFHVQLIRNMIMLLGEKNYALNSKIDLLILKGMREKLAAYLLQEAAKQNTDYFEIPPNRNELADVLNVSRTSMSRELARMKEDGLIDYYQNSFKILSYEGLKNCISI